MVGRATKQLLDPPTAIIKRPLLGRNGAIHIEPLEHPDSDRRLLRGEQTRRRIAEAMIGLLDTGDAKPTAQMIADKAGVSLRLVYHHFDDVDALFAEAAALQVSRHWKRVEAIPPTGPTAERIDLVCSQRQQLYTAIAPVRRAAGERARDSDALKKLLNASRRHLRLQLASTFEPELTAAGSESSLLLDTVELAASWETWDALRTGRARSSAASQRAMQRLLMALLN